MSKNAESRAGHTKPAGAAILEVEILSDYIPSQEDIAELAYFYWEARGCENGSPEEDWSRAEQELRKRGRRPKK